ncbi:hypothetical protein VNO77_35155 [Canavalia gladiata]|uniref:Uncharacterized protein n=1 Tax=Canavalia gladiata TaxID=3824 RepID=A0AAN9KEW8_CANGL
MHNHRCCRKTTRSGGVFLPTIEPPGALFSSNSSSLIKDDVTFLTSILFGHHKPCMSSSPLVVLDLFLDDTATIIFSTAIVVLLIVTTMDGGDFVSHPLHHIELSLSIRFTLSPHSPSHPPLIAYPQTRSP